MAMQQKPAELGVVFICPNCDCFTGILSALGDNGKLECDNCGAEFMITAHWEESD